MLSLLDIFLCFLIGIGLIFLFRLQKELFPHSYFAISGIISDIDSDQPDRKAILIRILIIIFYGFVLSFFISDSNLIVYGITLGAILIVWPIFLNDENIDPRFLHEKFLLRSFLLIFVIITYLSANFSLVIINLFHEIIAIYLNNFDAERIIGIIGDSLIWGILILALRWVYNFIMNRLGEKVTVTNSRQYENGGLYGVNYEEDMDINEYTYEQAEEESENER